MRIGGFGGIDGLARTIRDEKIDMMIDATHPFAEQISAHALAASKACGILLLTLTRAPWECIDGDTWIEVEDLPHAVIALGADPRRVLVTSGRLGLAAFEAAPQHDYLIRTIDPPDRLSLPRAKILLDRGPFNEASELALMQREKIDVLVTKNSGGTATYAKIAAARALRLPVVIIKTPTQSAATVFHDPHEVLRILINHTNGHT
jgi:precorrin-6A/cobalt-precorrin-6A reductase